jgi:hypothetical protein
LRSFELLIQNLKSKIAMESVQTAFVVLYEWSMVGDRTIDLDQLEPSIYQIRQAIPLTLGQAQDVLAETVPITPDALPAALVLLYEGVGAYRRTNYIFNAADMDHIAAARSLVQFSTQAGIAILSSGLD